MVKNLALLVAMAMAASAIKVGDNMPRVTIHSGFGPPTDVDMAARVADKKVILVGLPGAFTPT
jgi:peroxiredoxin